MCGISVIINGIEIVDPVQTTTINNNNNKVEENGEEEEFSTDDKFLNDIKSRLINRGPDSIKEETKVIKSKIQDSEEEISIELKLISSVLGLRGPLTVQPLKDDKGNILLWNGEMFGGYDIGVHDNDTCLLSHILSKLDDGDDSDNPRSLIDLMIKIKGPFAFLYWQEKKRKLWFGRDVLGRRSLLVNKNKTRMIISSIGSFPDGINDDDQQKLPRWDEINTFGLFSIEFPEIINNTSRQIKLNTHSWDPENLNLNMGITTLDYDQDDDDENEGDNNNNNNNNNSEGGIQDESKASATNTIDQLHFYPFGRRTKMSVENYSDEEFENYVTGFYRAISDSIYTRVCNLPDVSNEIPKLIRPSFLLDEPKPLVSRLAVLFSGGLDSMVLAAMSDKHIPLDESIHLINVAFGEDNSNSQDFDRVPDRKAAINGLKELRLISPTRSWKLIKVNVTTKEMEWAKKQVYQLSYPAITIMDMTICLALWFAGRGEGIIHYDDNEINSGIDINQRFMTTAKVLLMGSGADEQLAGYGRHRSAFARGSWETLQTELNKDFNRIWKRNLGRDDRVLSSNRREPRFPYLDENLIKYLNDVPLCYVCDLSQPQGTGDKRILREVGRRLGLTDSTRLIKKAIQFGSRSSKQLNKNIPARITQKCGVKVFSFTTPLYDPSKDPKFEENQKLKLKQQRNLEKKEKIKLKKEIDLKNLKEKQFKQQQLEEIKKNEDDQKNQEN